MSKPKLIYRSEDYPNFTQGWIRPLVDPWFEMEHWDSSKTYDPSVLVLTTYQQDFDPQSWYRPLEQRGHRIIVDHLFDSDVEILSRPIHDRKLDLRSPHWMWYRTALLMNNFGYDQYQPCPAYTHDFLCPMNKLRDHRDRVMTDLSPELATARWSYVERGHDIGDPNERNGDIYWAYYNNPQWYDSTPWSLVVESYMRGDPRLTNPSDKNFFTEISEKSYKPLAYYHPFIVVGSAYTLRFMHSQGFETWENLWDESYDSVMRDSERLDTVLEHVRDVVKTYNRHWTGWDSVTQQKLAHNHARFFDLNLVRLRFQNEIIGDILEFVS